MSGQREVVILYRKSFYQCRASTCISTERVSWRGDQSVLHPVISLACGEATPAQTPAQWLFPMKNHFIYISIQNWNPKKNISPALAGRPVFFIIKSWFLIILPLWYNFSLSCIFPSFCYTLWSWVLYKALFSKISL